MEQLGLLKWGGATERIEFGLCVCLTLRDVRLLEAGIGRRDNGTQSHEVSVSDRTVERNW